MARRACSGSSQYRLKLPAEIVWIHVAPATLLWVGIVLAAMQAGAPARLPGAPGPRRAGSAPALGDRGPLTLDSEPVVGRTPEDDHLNGAPGRAARSPRAPVAGLAAACVAAFGLIMFLGRGVGFYFDEWNFLLERRGHSADVFLKPHNEHISVVPVAIYKVLLQVVGVGHHWPYLAVLALMHCALGAGVFVLARRRVGGWAALGVAILILFMGLAWQNIVWSFQIGFVGSVLGGVWAFVALDRRDGRGDALACLALVLATLDSSLGVPLAVGVAAELLVARRSRALWVAAVPIGLYVVWYLGYGVGDITGDGSSTRPRGRSARDGIGRGALRPRQRRGVPLTLALFALLVWRTAVAPWTPRLAGLLVSGAAFWALTGAARSVFQPPVPPDTSRYLTLGGVVLALVAVELLAGVVLAPPRLLWIGAGVVALAVALGLVPLRDNARQLRTITGTTDAELGALALAARSAPPDYLPDSNLAPQLHAGSYLALARSLGSTAGDTPAELSGDLSGERAAADRVLQELTARLAPAPGRPASCTTTAATVTSVPVPAGGLVIQAPAGRASRSSCGASATGSPNRRWAPSPRAGRCC